MQDPLPKFDAPPVVETVLGAQFARLPKFSTAHVGWFWKECLSPEWTTVQQRDRLADTFERFGDEIRWGPEHMFFVRSGSEPERILITQENDERLIQIQDSRFIYNWRRRESAYPAYKSIHPEFQSQFAKFSEFASRTRGLGTLDLNQWEVAYINHLPQGEMWNTVQDWPSILPGLYAPRAIGGADQPVLDQVSGNWAFELLPRRGRIHISLQLGRAASAEGPTLLIFTLTARGPIADEKGLTLEGGFALGHEAIVRTFASMTSAKAHQHWKRRA